MKDFLLKNWKTNLLSVLGLSILAAYMFKQIDTEQLISIQGFLVALGFFAAKDSDWSRSSKPDVPPEDQ
jgi:hypothetical protein